MKEVYTPAPTHLQCFGIRLFIFKLNLNFYLPQLYKSSGALVYVGVYAAERVLDTKTTM